MDKPNVPATTPPMKNAQVLRYDLEYVFFLVVVVVVVVDDVDVCRRG